MAIFKNPIWRASVAVWALCGAPVLAQDLGAAQGSGTIDKDRIIVGIGAVHAPAYQGADKYRTLPLPAIDIVQGPLFLNMRNGLGINVIQSGSLTFGGSVAPMPGYRRRDVPTGIDRIPFGAGGRIFAIAKAGSIVATLGGTQGFAGGTKGFIADASLSYPLAVSSRLLLVPTIGTTWANRKHNDHYFGIDAREAEASGLPRFDVGAGFKDVTAMMTVNYRLTRRINLSASAGVTTLLGDSADSPIVAHKTQPVAFLAATFPLGR